MIWVDGLKSVGLVPSDHKVIVDSPSIWSIEGKALSRVAWVVVDCVGFSLLEELRTEKGSVFSVAVEPVMNPSIDHFVSPMDIVHHDDSFQGS